MQCQAGEGNGTVPLGQEGPVKRIGALLSRDLIPEKRGPKPKEGN